jgi:hypothetical protein
MRGPEERFRRFVAGKHQLNPEPGHSDFDGRAESLSDNLITAEMAATICTSKSNAGQMTGPAACAVRVRSALIPATSRHAAARQ